MARFFFALSRILLASMFVMAIISPVSAQESEPETTCADQEDVTSCTVHVNDYDAPPVVYMTVAEDQTAVEIITYTSLTCDNHGLESIYADPYLILYDSGGTIIGEDDDSASHNDGSNMCWDSYLNLTLDAGDYELSATAYDEETIGTYTLEFSGVSWSLSNDPEPAPDPEPTPTPDDSVPDEEVEPTPEPVEPTPEPDPEPEPTPTPEEEVEPPVNEPIQSPTPLPEQPEEEPEPDPVWEPPIEDTLPDPELILPSPFEENPLSLVTIDIEELEDDSFNDDIIWDLEDVEWDDFEWDELPEIEELDELLPEEDEAEAEEEATFVDEGEQEQPDEVQSDVELEEEFVLEEYEDIEEIDFEELDADELDDEIIAEILQDEEAVEVFLEEVLKDNPDFFEGATEDQVSVIFESAPELFNEASDEVKDELEAEINVYAGGFGEYVPEDSTISVDERRSIIAVATATATIATVAVARPTPPPTPRPTTPTPPRPSSPSAVSPSGPTIRRNNDKT